MDNQTCALPENEAKFARSLGDLMPRLASYAQSLSRNPDIAQDLVQETMLKAWRSRNSFVIGTNLKAWTFQILRNSFLSQVRRPRVVQTSASGELSDLPVAANQEMFVTLNDVRRLWNRLTPEQQRCIQFVGIDGFSYDEVAVIEQVPVGTIKSRVVRGRQMLRNLLDQPSTSASEPRKAHLLPTSREVPTGSVPSDETTARQIELLRRWRAQRAANRLDTVAGRRCSGFG